MRCRVLGPLEVVDDDGRPVVVRGDRQRALLATLVVHVGEVVPVDRLVEGLWEGAPPADPSAALQSQVSRLRRALTGDGVIETHPGGYRLGPSVEVDALEFDRLVATARAMRARDTGQAVEHLDEALGLWRGEAYADVASSSTVRPEAVRLTEARVAAAEDRADLLLASGRIDESVAELERLVVDQPDRERTQALLMRALYASGRQADALGTYQRYRQRLAGELGLDPSPALQELEGQILRQELEAPRLAPAGRPTVAREASRPDPAASTAAGVVVPSGLPRPATGLLGRSADLAGIADVLGRARVVTLIGPGGVGKSRLAVEAATLVADRYPGGVVLFELAALDRAADVPAALASQVGLPYREGVAVTDRLVESFGRAPRLLVLDNAEHVLDGVAGLLEAIVPDTGLDVLVTSREPLGIDGEQVWPVDPLDVEGGALELFLDRACAADPHLDVVDAGIRALARELCVRLDGIPLCLELAAARLRVLSLAEVVDALDDRFALLGTGRRTAALRHRSLDALVQWSFDLLGDVERRLFLAVSVFASSFDLEDARAVAAASGLEPDQTGPVLWSLVEKSLLARSVDGGGTRFRLLETLRDFGRSRLTPEERRAVSEAHAHHVVTLVGELDRRSVGPEEREVARAVEDLVPEMRAAHQWLLSSGEIGWALRLSDALPWWASAHMQGEAFDWATETAEAARGLDHPLLPSALASAAVGAWQRGDLVRGRELAVTGLAEAERLGVEAPTAIDALGDISLFEGELDAAAEWYRQAAASAAGVGDVRRHVLATCNLALAAGYAGRLDEARAEVGTARSQAEELRVPSLLAWVSYTEGEIELEHGDGDRALERLEAAVSLTRDSGDRFMFGVASLSALTLRARRGDEAALPDLGELIEHWRQSGVWTQQWTTLRNLIVLLVELGRHRDAARLVGAVQRAERSPEPFGPEAERLERAMDHLRQGLDGDFDALVGEGAALDDEATVAYAIEITRRGD